MWKIFCKYDDGGKITITGKGKGISLDLAEKYYMLYGILSDSCIFQQYPKKENESIELVNKINKMRTESGLDELEDLPILLRQKLNELKEGMINHE